MGPSRFWLVVGAIYGFLAVVLGAFGAHALAKVLTPDDLNIYHTATQYLTTHGLALFVLGVWGTVRTELSGRKVYFWAGLSFALGTLIFSGSLYVLVLSGVRIWGAVTPLGGLLFLLGWLQTAWLAYRFR